MNGLVSAAAPTLEAAVGGVGNREARETMLCLETHCHTHTTNTFSKF